MRCSVRECVKCLDNLYLTAFTREAIKSEMFGGDQSFAKVIPSRSSAVQFATWGNKFC